MTYSAILYEKQGQVVTVTLNRPGALNALNRQLTREIGQAIQEFDRDDDARVAIITGSGRAFCAGRDLKERAEDNAAGIQARALDSMRPESVYVWPRTWKPLIAAINGYTMGGGWALAQMCDLRIAAEDARMGITEARWGLLPPFAAVLPKLVPMARVLELAFTAEPMTAQQACDIGFVNRVVPAERLLDEVMTLARRIGENAPLSLRCIKEMAYQGLDMGEQSVASLARHLYDSLLRTEDARDGPRAFAEKRKPDWKGR